MQSDKWYSNIRLAGQQFSESHIVLAMVFAVLYLPFMYYFGYGFLSVENCDLPSFWCAAKAAFALSLSPYRRSVLQGILPSQYVYQYVYPPQSLLMFYPLSFLSYQWAKIATLALNHMLVLFLLWFVPVKLLKLSVQRDTLSMLLCLVYILTFNPLVKTIGWGQVNLLLACSIFVFWYFVKSNHVFWASVSLVSAILLKTHLLVLLFPLIICKQYRIILYAAILLAWVSVVTFLLIPSQAWQDWFVDVLPSLGYTGSFLPASSNNLSLNGFISHVFLKSRFSPHPLVESPAFAAIASYGTATVVFLLSFYAARKRFVKYPLRSFDWAMLIFLPLVCLVSPLSWDHHLVYLLAGLLILLNSVVTGETGSIKISVLVLLCAITISVEGGVKGKFPAVLGIWIISVFLAMTSQRDFLLD
jgi:alpha-1,2-mannosyltransferase